MRTVTVKSGNYPVLIGPGLLKEAGERIAQGTVLVTTFASLPVVVGIAAIFHALGVVS